MRLSESYQVNLFEGVGKRQCVICGKITENGGLWYGHSSNPDSTDDRNRATVVCGNYCLEKILQLVMDSLIDTRPQYKQIDLEDEKALFDLLENDMQQLLQLAITKKIANVRLRKLKEKEDY